MSAPPASGTTITAAHRRVIFASSLGTVFEWYDFYLYGSLAAFFGKLFFPPGNDTAALLASLATFGAGFAVRPFGALVFGRIGDIIGRKYTFLVTIVVMGSSTALVGLLPTYAQIGVWAPILLVALRLAQGLALGGEYGGAATYVAEHAPHGQRGSYTSWIQTTATLGFFLSLAIILLIRLNMSVEDFTNWGWRIPFIVSVILLGVSVYIRLQLEESPLFAEMKAQGKTSKAPLTESFTKGPNLKIVVLALLGATAGQGVVWYTGQFYALYFLTTVLKLDFKNAYILISIGLVIGTPFFIVFGKLSDKIGRKMIMMVGCLLAAVTFIPIFQQLTKAVNPALADAMEKTPVVLHSDEFSRGKSLVGSALLDVFGGYKPGDADAQASAKARAFLVKSGIPFKVADPKDGAPLTLSVGGKDVKGFDENTYKEALAPAAYPKAADPAAVNWPITIVLISILMIYVTMVYGPIAAFLVELFPTRIRYTSMSLPYHIGNGWFGGFLPLIATSLVVFTGDIYFGLWYPITIAVMTFVIGMLFIRETKDNDINK